MVLQAVDMVREHRASHAGSVEGVAETLVEVSIARNILDNVTCIVVGLDIKR